MGRLAGDVGAFLFGWELSEPGIFGILGMA